LIDRAHISLDCFGITVPASATPKCWSHGITLDIAGELRRRFAEYDDLPAVVQDLLERVKALKPQATGFHLMTVFVYVNTSKQIGDPEHAKVFATADAAAKWFEENNPEGVAFEYDVLERIELAAGR
jgi:hypothetical protein